MEKLFLSTVSGYSQTFKPQERQMTTIAYDAKRLVRNRTGLGNYSRTLVNDLQRQLPKDYSMLLYAPDKGSDDLRSQVTETERLKYVYPEKARSGVARAVWRSWGIVKDLKRDHVDIYHGLSGELPIGIKASGIKSVVTIHDLIFLRHPEYYNPIDAAVYKGLPHRVSLPSFPRSRCIWCVVPPQQDECLQAAWEGRLQPVLCSCVPLSFPRSVRIG